MSLNLGNISGLTWQGNPVALPIKLCTPIDPQWGPKEVRIDIDWTASPYLASSANPNVGVAVNLANQAVKTPLEAVRFVKIDNSFNDTPVYLQFADSLDAITCPANAVVGVPTMTNTLLFKVYGTGFFDGRSPVTSVFLSNAPQDAYFIPDAGRYRVTGGLTDFVAVTNSPSSNTFNRQIKIGSAFSDRIVVAIAYGMRPSGGSLNIPTSITIGGGSNVLLAGQAQSSTSQSIAIAAKAIPSSSLATVIVNYPSTNTWNALAMYSLRGVSSITPLDLDDDVSTTTNWLDTSVVQLRSIPGSFGIYGFMDNVAIPEPFVYGGPIIDGTISRAASPLGVVIAASYRGVSPEPVSGTTKGGLGIGAVFR